MSEVAAMNGLWMYSITAEEALRWIHEFASLRLAEATKEMYPKEFVAWILTHAASDINEELPVPKWTAYLSGFSNKIYWTTDELFECWKQNINKH